MHGRKLPEAKEWTPNTQKEEDLEAQGLGAACFEQLDKKS